ncbi:hypothetical protein [Sphingomonas sp. Leaf62]|nr:hypothetical protein [Sphingomonas sp. Leaf62]
MTEAVQCAAEAWWVGQRGPVPLSVADRSNGCPDFAPTAGGAA